ncbi:hypothetical protein ACKWTF_005970 [Chironomus riparius]
MEVLELDSLFLSKRILVDTEECKDFVSGGVLVSNIDGTIKRIFTSQEEINSWMFRSTGADVYDFKNKIIMSGLIDANVNICSGSGLEDFSSITKAASAGGYTCIVDNPMFSKPATTTLKNLKAKIVDARSKNSLNIDVGFWGGVTRDNHDELIAMANQGVCGFKAILNPQDSHPDFSHLCKEDLKKALEVLEEINCVFAIKPDMELKEPIIPENANLKDYNTYLTMKHPSMEKCGIEMVLDLIKEHKMKIHLTDLSSSEFAPLIQKYRNQKTPKQSTLSVETSLHYLSLASEEIGSGMTEYKCSPPIRNGKNKRQLWDSMKMYDFFNISSSHLPSSIKTKCLIGGRNRGNFIEAANGISSLQFGLPIFWTECRKNRMSIHDVHQFMSCNPAKLCGFDKNKGKLKPGYDADFCIWDPDEEWTITKEATLFKNIISPYFGKTVVGRVYATVVRGYFVYDANRPNETDEPIGTVVLKKPMKRSERAIRFTDNDNNEDDEL